ncbi:serine/threonine-protein kinase [Actinoplanes sp. NPDC023801]|uniref:serine/threonine protein kinase n=1 Tax=Actinoplanes sp. NPDC023801 TaxID=3154595 RepID=UPI0033C5EF8E
MVDDGALPGERTQPLRKADPRSLGDYELVGRLGEGGMGTVYLARTAGGVLVAVKMVRADLAHDDEFRRRFRSEVDRARQVPPFCTAEVIDADPDHESPYLVVEFVDGPTLAEVVEQRGPLTSANLHGVAIGVATALTAIHGAGVIHRDLKPRNVLLAPGSPKVIDFGIARAMEATSANTRTDQMVGTVAYMAPERFSSDAEVPLTPAADVFAWGSVVAYAGTGHTPFYADSPPAMAARILTQPPKLDGLSGPLRDLVAHSLEKDPANRPSSRELLDLLISGKQRPAATAAAFADQPDLRVAATEAQAVTGVSAEPSVSLPTLAIPPGLVGYDENSIVTVPISAPVPQPARRPVARQGRRWAMPVLLAVFVTALVAGAVLVAVELRNDDGRRADAVSPASPAPTPIVTITTPADPPRVQDTLLRQALWTAKELPEETARCYFADGLVARRERGGVFKCSGPLDEIPADMHVEVTTRLITRGSCAAIWFRNSGQVGYQARVCENDILLALHNRNGDGKITVFKTFPLGDTPIGLAPAAARIGLITRGDTVEVYRNGILVGTAPLAEERLQAGRVLLGIYNGRDTPDIGPYEVAFNDIKIWDVK